MCMSPPASFNGTSVRWGHRVWIFVQLIFDTRRHTEGTDNAVIVIGPSLVSILNLTSSANIWLMIPVTLILKFWRFLVFVWCLVVESSCYGRNSYHYLRRNSRVASVSTSVSFRTLTLIVPRAVLGRWGAANWLAMMVMINSWWWLRLQYLYHTYVLFSSISSGVRCEVKHATILLSKASRSVTVPL